MDGAHFETPSNTVQILAKTSLVGTMALTKKSEGPWVKHELQSRARAEFGTWQNPERCRRKQ